MRCSRASIATRTSYPPPGRCSRVDPGFDILHEDADCLVVAKPGGLLTQAPLGIESLELRIKRYLQARDQIAGDVYLGVPHRIDRPASGVIVFAKTRKAAQKISTQFERRFVEKTYWALVEGHVEPAAGTWIDQLKKVYGQPRTMIVDPSDPMGQQAILHYRALRHLAAATILEIALETGRTHQIRVQCASRGHPLLGDELYGSTTRFGPWHEDERERLIALHARSLRFRHPTTRDDILLVAPLPAIWAEAGVAD
jgi:23S rRNA pseudouridine1911/1915/1917 synthase